MKLAAVLLAGGMSSRMGRDKATMMFRGQLLWQRQIEILRELEPEELVISAQTDPSWRPADCDFVSDAVPSRGPLSGIAAAWSRVTRDHLLALAIDMPFMSANYLHGLCQQIQPGVGVIPAIGNRFEPLAAIYPREATVDFNEALSSADFSLQSLAKKLIAAGKLTAVQVSRGEAPLFRNLNEPQDL